MFETLKTYLVWIALAAALVTGALIGGCATALVKNADIAALERDAAETARQVAIETARESEINRVRERALIHQFDRALESYEKEKIDAQTNGDRIARAVHDDALRLRDHWAGCETSRLSGIAAAARDADALARDRADSAGRIVRAADQCDAHVRALQQLLISERTR